MTEVISIAQQDFKHIMTAVTTQPMRWKGQDEPGRSEVDGEDPVSSEEDEGRESIDDFLPIQSHSRPATPEDKVFERDVLVLSNGKTEDELNKRYKSAALDLGLDGEKKSRKASDATEYRASSVTVSSSVQDSLSRTSQSTPPTSCDSSEMQGQYTYSHEPPSQLKVPEVIPRAPASRHASRPASVISSRSITSSIRSGLRRLSTFSRRKPSERNELLSSESTPCIHNSSISDARSSVASNSRPTTSRHRPTTSNSTLTPTSPTSSRAPSLASYHSNIHPQLASPANYTRSPRTLSRGQSLPSMSGSITGSISSRKTNFSVPFSTSGQTRSQLVQIDRSRAKSSDARTVHSQSCRGLSPTLEEDFSPIQDQAAARARTARNRELGRLRSNQKAEQRRFLSFQRDTYSRAKMQHGDAVREAKKAWAAKEHAMEARHAQREQELESRHLSAEIDLQRALEAEKRSLEARLRHMEGYVRGRGIYDVTTSPASVGADGAGGGPEADAPIGVAVSSGAPGADKEGGATAATTTTPATLHLPPAQFPARQVSSHSMQLLAQQYRLRSQMPQLHVARINVLREQQAVQLARLQAKQQGEVAAFESQRDAALAADLPARWAAAARELRQGFAARRDRMIWRWKVAEEMERRRLEDERGVPFAEMDKLGWSEDAWMGEAL